MLLADVALLAAVWFDARRAIPLGGGGLRGGLGGAAGAGAAGGRARRPGGGGLLPATGARATAGVGRAGRAPTAGCHADPPARRGAAVRIVARVGAGRRPAPHRLEGDRQTTQGHHAAIRGRAAPAGAAGARYRPAADRYRAPAAPAG